jgi:hypothetical protein
MTDQELKELVASLAITQKRTNILLEKTDEKLLEIFEQQKKTDVKFAELAEQQKKTDVKVAELTEQQKKSDVKFTEVFVEMAEQQKKSDVKFAEVFTEMAEQQKKTDARFAEVAEQQKKTDARFEKMDARFEKADTRFNKLQKSLDQAITQLGGMGNIQGDIAEDLFRRNIASLLAERGIEIDRVKTNLKTDNAEYDIVAINGDEVVVLEVKNKLTSHHIRHFLNKRLPLFKREHPTFAHHKVYGAVGSLIVPEQLEKQAAKEGLFIFTQTQQGASIANQAHFRAKEF